jgi:hypothetical protein
VSAGTLELSAAELGGILFRRGMLSAVNLEWALDTQARSGSPLSVILIAAGLVHRQDRADRADGRLSLLRCANLTKPAGWS